MFLCITVFRFAVLITKKYYFIPKTCHTRLTKTQNMNIAASIHERYQSGAFISIYSDERTLSLRVRVETPLSWSKALKRLIYFGRPIKGLRVIFGNTDQFCSDTKTAPRESKREIERER